MHITSQTLANLADADARLREMGSHAQALALAHLADLLRSHPAASLDTLLALAIGRVDLTDGADVANITACTVAMQEAIAAADRACYIGANR